MKLDRTGTFLIATAREFIEDSCQLRSASLAFSSLLALVPLSATVFSISAAFGAFADAEEQIKSFLLQQLIPTRQDEILAALENFVNNAGKLGIAGFLVFAFTSISLLNGINMNCNAVWGSRVRRGFFGIFTTYTSIIVFGTILIGASFTVTAAAGSLIRTVLDAPWLMSLGLRITPPLLTFLLFLLTILLVPTGPVALKSASLGALGGTILWEAVKFGFVRGTNFVLRTSIIYGSIATIPIFLVWLYLAWLIFFAALEIAYVHQHADASYATKRENGHIEKGLLMLQIFRMLLNAHLRGNGPGDVRAIMLEKGIDQKRFYELIQPFLDRQMVYLDRKEGMLLFARDPDSITVAELLQILFPLQAVPREMLDESGGQLLSAFVDAGLSSFRSVSVRDYFTLHAKGMRDPEEDS